MTFSLAHLSDPHLPLPEAPRLGSLTAKQLLAYLSWQRRRRHVTSPTVLAALRADLALLAPEHIAVTGDLVNLATPAEFAASAAWLEDLAAVARVTVIPGNHELTRRQPWASGLGRWNAWMNAAATERSCFPFLHRRGEVALIGLSSAVATPLLLASGRVGTRQLDRAAALLHQTGAEGLFRVVLIHHPPVIDAGGWRKALRDRAALCGILERAGAELVLHGHHHTSRLAYLRGPTGPIPILGVPSASAGAARPAVARWNLHRITRAGAGWRLITQARIYDPAAGRFTGAGTWTLGLGADQ